MKILLTGSFGNVGAHTLAYLAGQGHAVTCFDVESKANRKKEQKLARHWAFDTCWGDLRQAQVVQELVAQVRPEAILHLAAVIPPFAYLNPGLAYEVNVGGTRHLLAAAQALDRAPHFVYISSYSVHGPRNPHQNLPLLRGDTPLDPGDNYGRHKVAGERMVRDSGLPWTILRLCGIMPVDVRQMQNPAMARYLFLLPPEQRQQGIDVRDAALAVANAASAGAEGRTLEIGGGEDWQWRTGDFVDEMFVALGIGTLPRTAFRRCDPAVDASWYYEDWVDATESQALLQYQVHSRTGYLDALKRQVGLGRFLIRLLAPAIRCPLLGQSPYYGQANEPDSRTHWDVACELYGIKPGEKS